jgi:RNA polymerase sigma-70 factor (ECF subfamily)
MHHSIQASVQAHADLSLEVVDRSGELMAGLMVRGKKKGIAIELLEDLAQEALFATWRAAHKGAITESIKAYAYRALDNLIISNWRKHGRHVLTSFDSHDPCSAIAYSHDGDPCELASSKEHARIVRQLLETLPEDKSEVILLRFFGDMSYSDIAEELDIPVGTVKSRLFNALALLRERFP